MTDKRRTLPLKPLSRPHTHLSPTYAQARPCVQTGSKCVTRGRAVENLFAPHSAERFDICADPHRLQTRMCVYRYTYYKYMKSTHGRVNHALETINSRACVRSKSTSAAFSLPRENRVAHPMLSQAGGGNFRARGREFAASRGESRWPFRNLISRVASR